MKESFIYIISCMALLVGCQQADEVENESEKLPMSIEASIGESEIVSGRYVGSEPNAVSFTNGDGIGVSVNGGNFVEWRYDGGSWRTDENSDAYWADKKDPHTFHAFYPYDEVSDGGDITMPDLTAQDGTMESVSECDFLVATKTQAYGTDGVVSFTGDCSFKHVSSLVKITLKGDGDLASAYVDSISLSGQDIITLSTYSFGGDEAKVTLDKSDEGDSLVLSVSCNMSSKDKTFYCILNAGTVDLSLMKMSVSYVSSEKNYKAELSGMGEEGNRFVGGKQYNYTLTVADGKLTITGGSIANWETGTDMEITVNGTVQPESDNENA